jgi:hypothetical protein
MEEFYNFVIQFATFPVAIICFGIGYAIKHYIPKISNNYIPLILACAGLIINLLLNGFNFTYDVVMTGVGSGLIATGSFELVRNLAKKNNKE